MQTEAAASSIVFSGLMPHPPICVPEVGGERGAACSATTRACEELARRLVEARPERLFLVSPHSPRDERALGIWTGEVLRGDLAAFGAPEVRVELPVDRELGAGLASELGPDASWWIQPEPLDHGAMVPLAFLARAGWQGPTCVVSLPASENAVLLAGFGGALRRALTGLGGRAAVIASGDMSHRVLEGAPAGFHPRAVEFDERVCDIVEAGRFADLEHFDPELRALAAEDVIGTTWIVATAIRDLQADPEVLSYEHPFGVGYLVALFVASP